MAKPRTDGQTVIGVINVVLGGMGVATLLLLTLLVSTLLAVMALKPVAVHLDRDSFDASAIVSLLAAPASGALDILLLVAGIQVLRMAPSGRTLSLLYAWLVLPLCAMDFWIFCGRGEFFLLRLGLCMASPLYAVLLIVLFLRPSWRKAFQG